VSRARVACIIPAHDAAERIGATVEAVTSLPGVGIVLVCDDGSSDATEQRAAAAGAVVVTHSRSRGRAAAIESAVNALGVLEQRDRRPEAGTLLLVHGELGAGAASLVPLVAAVRDDQADLAIAVPPVQDSGLVSGTAARGITQLTGWTPTAPLSAQRCLTRRAFELASPLAAGWGADVGMIIDVLRAGLRVREVGVGAEPPRPAADLTGSLQRAAQLRDVTRALVARGAVNVDTARDAAKTGLAQVKDAGSGLLRRLRG
jgi:hypothetical protein